MVKALHANPQVCAMKLTVSELYDVKVFVDDDGLVHDVFLNQTDIDGNNNKVVQPCCLKTPV